MKLFPLGTAALLALGAWPPGAHSAQPIRTDAYPSLRLAQAPPGVTCVAGVVTNPAEGSPTAYPCPPGTVPSNTTGSDAPKPPPAGAAGPVGGGPLGYTVGGTAATGTPPNADNAAGTSNIGTSSGIGGVMDIGGMTAGSISPAPRGPTGVGSTSAPGRTGSTGTR